MRILPVVGLVILSAFGGADQFLSIPTAAKVPYQDFKFDFATGFSSPIGAAYADYGIGKSFEATLKLVRPLDLASVGTFDLAYNYISPIAGLLPGVSMGVQDMRGVTPEGRRFYIAATTREIYPTDSGDSPGDVTLGVFVGRRTSPFLGLDLPMSNYLHLVASHDGYVITAGLEYRTSPKFGLRLVAVDGRPEIGVSTLTRF